MLANVHGQYLGQWHHAVFRPLGIAHHDLPIPKVDILNPQADALHKTHAGAVEETRHEPLDALHLLKQRTRLATREHHRQPARTFGPDQRIEPVQRPAQHLLVEEYQGVEGLILGIGRHLPLHREMLQKALHLGPTELSRSPTGTESDIPAHPLLVDLLGADGITTTPDLRNQRRHYVAMIYPNSVQRRRFGTVPVRPLSLRFASDRGVPRTEPPSGVFPVPPIHLFRPTRSNRSAEENLQRLDNLGILPIFEPPVYTQRLQITHDILADVLLGGLAGNRPEVSFDPVRVPAPLFLLNALTRKGFKEPPPDFCGACWRTGIC